MNVYFILAIICGTLATICTIKGGLVHGKQSSEAQIAAIDKKLESFAKNYTAINSNVLLKEDRKQEVKRINDYEQIAKEYYKMLPVKMAEKKANSAKAELESLKKSSMIEGLLKDLEISTRNLVEAYNNTDNATDIKLVITDFPKNLHELESRNSYHILLYFTDDIIWGIRFVTYPDQTLALQLVKLLSPSKNSRYEELQLTNDSINLVFGDNKFGISLNSRISNETKEFLVKDIMESGKEIDNFNPVAETLIKRIIEHEIMNLKEKS